MGADYLHKSCSSATKLLHELDSARRGPHLHNSCVARKLGKEAKSPLDVEMGRRLRAAREERGWSQERLAAETGYVPDQPVPKGAMHPSTVAMCERGERRVQIEDALTLSRIFELPAPYWLGLIDLYEAEVLQAIKRPRRAAASGR